MKQLIWRLVIPLTIISFFLVTKCWFVAVEDAPDSWMYGFPFPYLCEGWHTSLSLQVFLKELFMDLGIYVLFWTATVFLVNKFLGIPPMPRPFTIILWVISGVILFAVIWVASMPEHIFLIQREFDCEVIASGFKFPWQVIERPN
ncbi:MAG: hypothetical protein AAF655_22070 [Bacteroidota bacterium]